MGRFACDAPEVGSSSASGGRIASSNGCSEGGCSCTVPRAVRNNQTPAIVGIKWGQVSPDNLSA